MKYFFFDLNFSLKDFIRDSSSDEDDNDEEDPAEFYPKVNRLINKDSSWRKFVSLKFLLCKIKLSLLGLIIMMIIHRMNQIEHLLLQKVMIINQQQRKKF